MVKSRTTYDVEVVCRNCGNVSTVEGVFGKPLPDSTINQAECDVCGCTGVLMRAFGDGEEVLEEGDEEVGLFRSKVPPPRF